jgi:hypothetical protein
MYTLGVLGWAMEYQDNQVWRLQVDTSSQIDQLARLEVTEYMDFWTEVSKLFSLHRMAYTKYKLCKKRRELKGGEFFKN